MNMLANHSERLLRLSIEQPLRPPIVAPIFQLRLKLLRARNTGNTAISLKSPMSYVTGADRPKIEIDMTIPSH
jgi:hypothetical protein